MDTLASLFLVLDQLAILWLGLSLLGLGSALVVLLGAGDKGTGEEDCCGNGF